MSRTVWLNGRQDEVGNVLKMSISKLCSHLVLRKLHASEQLPARVCEAEQ